MGHPKEDSAPPIRKLQGDIAYNSLWDFFEEKSQDETGFPFYTGSNLKISEQSKRQLMTIVQLINAYTKF